MQKQPKKVHRISSNLATKKDKHYLEKFFNIIRIILPLCKYNINI